MQEIQGLEPEDPHRQLFPELTGVSQMCSVWRRHWLCNSIGAFGNSAQVRIGVVQGWSRAPCLRIFLELEDEKIGLQWGYETPANACVKSCHLICLP